MRENHNYLGIITISTVFAIDWKKIDTVVRSNETPNRNLALIR